MQQRFSLPGRISSGHKFLMFVATLVYLLLLVLWALGPHGFNYGLAMGYPVAAVMFFAFIGWINMRGGIQWDNDTIYEVSFLASFFPRLTRGVSMDAVRTVFGTIEHDGAVSKRLFIPFDTIVMEIDGEKPLHIQADFTDQDVLKHLLGIIQERGKALFADDVLAYISSDQRVF